MVAITVSASALSLRPSTPMSSRRRPSSAPCPPARLRAALEAIEVPDCDCKLDLRPVCQAHGAPGCDLRRAGHLCDCPRWPGPPCEHLTSYTTRASMADAFRVIMWYCPPGIDPESFWALLLWTLRAEQFADRRRPGSGANMIDRETRVTIMALRASLKLSLWHPDDVRRPSEGGGEAHSEQGQHLARLLQCSQQRGGGHVQPS